MAQLRHWETRERSRRDSRRSCASAKLRIGFAKFLHRPSADVSPSVDNGTRAGRVRSDFG